MSAFGTDGFTLSSAVLEVPWATMAVPCGRVAIRTIVTGSFGLLVRGTCAQMPGSRCSPAPRFLSVICWR
ncbi:hypothetical protein KIH74_04535 [Kineosporia sp. J2-2]|uniref:Uncharacterized protein n=1 Tax=Kineosporia corallincola TaxID=2835133 RepID=A0ABS5TDA5_9ACTN|nr:hypothetical protein [Kineosporia corallincola]MBT0768176.1 hypothetical protein [Kineosporia corallincola]